jgi:N-acylneuraminate cytidylyltransferase
LKSPKIICIIPARRNSKRLLLKNTRLLGGYPLIVHSILYAKKFEQITDIYITTDDDDVKSITEAYDIKVIERPKELSGDAVATVSAIKHVLESLNDSYDHVILLQPTNPLRPKTLLNEAYSHFIESGCDSLMTVSRNHQKFGKIVNNRFIPFNYIMGQRSQDLEPLYFENGLLYITKSSLIMNDCILGDNNFPFIVDHPYASVDIDTEEDLLYAEFILKQHPNA